MAKESSTARSAVRRGQSAPKDAPAATAPARATRSTRSQSREPSEQPSTTQQRGKGRGGAAKKAGGRKKGNADLETVEEDPAPEETIPVAADNEDAEEAADAAVAALESRRMSVGAMSGTTAKTSFSQEEIGALDPDVMVDVLPNLAGASGDLAKLLLPADPKSRPVVRKEIRKGGTKYNKLYHNRCEAIGIHKKAFGSMDLIQPSIVLRALLGVQQLREVPQGDWRPDNIIYKINLAQMLRTVLITLLDNTEISAEGFDEISNLDTSFASGIAGGVFSPSAFQMALELLTQLAIVRLTAYRTDPSFSPTKTIVETFYLSDAEGSPVFKHANVLHMGDLDGDQQEAYTQAIQHRVDQLTDLFNEADPTSWTQAINMLRVQFTWDEFLEHTTQYYLQRSSEIDAEIAAAGGMERIMSVLSEEVDRRTDARKAAEKRRSFSRPDGMPKKGFGKGGMRALRERERMLKANAAIPPASAPVAQMIQPDLGQPEQTAPPALGDDWMRHEDDVASPQRTETTGGSNLAALSGIQNMQRQNAARAKGKGRSFLDPQPDAVRVSFDSQSQTMEYDAPGYQQQTSQPGPYYQSPARATTKRTHAQMDDDDQDFDPTQDEGFQTDMRDTSAADQRRRELPPARAPQPRFSSIGSGVPGPSAGSASGSPSKRARKNPGSSMPPPQRPFDPEDDHDLILSGGDLMNQARRNARNFSVMAVSRKPTQVRTPWSNDEETALIDYIGREGGEHNSIPYATIKTLDRERPDPQLQRRSAEDMRFKARNMKECMLKGHIALPPNFEHIALDRKAIVKLHSLGIAYEQESIRQRTVVDE